MNQIICGDALEELKKLKEKSINCVVTSPPYWGLRSYLPEEHKDKNKELGLEPTFKDYVNNLCDIFDEVRRILRDDGTCWVNISDSYSTGKGPRTDDIPKNILQKERSSCKNLPMKSLCNIPARFSIEMQNRGWILRNEIIWYKRAAMPSCLHPKTKVFVKRDSIMQINMEEINKGDLILTPTGWKRVLNKWTTVKKPVKLKVGNVSEITCSPEHRFAISHDKRRNKINYIQSSNIRGKNKKGHDYFIYKNLKKFFDNSKLNIIDIIKNNNLEWFVDIIDIKEGLKIQSPMKFAKKVGDKSLRKIKCNSTWTYASNTHNELRRGRIRTWKINNKDFEKVYAKNSPIKENRYYDLDYNMGWLIGVYTAEGGFNQPRGFQGKITINKNEIEIRDKFKSIFHNKFGHPIQNERKINNCRVIKFTSASMYVLCKEIFIKGKCKTKKLVIDNFLNSPPEFREGFIKGYFDGDGYKKDNKKTVTSASFQLIKDVQIILASLGKLYSKGVFKNKRTKKKYFSLWSNSYQKYNNRDLTYSRLKEKLKNDEEINMVDIEVEDGLFLIEEGLISHNSIKDRFTVDFEKIFFFVKQRKYYFKQQFEPLKEISKKRAEYGWHGNKKTKGIDDMDKMGTPKNGRNKRCVWDITTKGYKGAHIAVYPPDLVKTPIDAGCPKYICKKCDKPREKIIEIVSSERSQKGRTKSTETQRMGKTPVPEKGWLTKKIDKGYTDCGCNAGWRRGVVLDPFFGAGTTGLAAFKQGKDFIGIELSPKYVELARKRLGTLMKQKRLQIEQDY